MVRKSYKINESNDENFEVEVEEKSTFSRAKKEGSVPIAEEERMDTPDIDAKYNNQYKGDFIEAGNRRWRRPGSKCYWAIATIAGLACLIAVITLVTIKGNGNDNGTQTENNVAALSSDSKLTGKLTAYPRFKDNLEDRSEIMVCNRTLQELQFSVSTMLKSYENFDKNNYKDCDVETVTDDAKPCSFDVSKIPTSCRADNFYGYNIPSIAPCFFLRIEDSDNWTPKDIIDKTKNEPNKTETELKYFKVECKVRDNGKIGNLNDTVGEIKVEPKNGFLKRYFPQSNFDSKYYLPPLVVVQILQPKIGVEITVDCKIEIGNRKELKFDGQTIIRFKIMDKTNVARAPNNRTEESTTATTDKITSSKLSSIDLATAISGNSSLTEIPIARTKTSAPTIPILIT